MGLLTWVLFMCFEDHFCIVRSEEKYSDMIEKDIYIPWWAVRGRVSLRGGGASRAPPTARVEYHEKGPGLGGARPQPKPGSGVTPGEAEPLPGHLRTRSASGHLERSGQDLCSLTLGTGAWG